MWLFLKISPQVSLKHTMMNNLLITKHIWKCINCFSAADTCYFPIVLKTRLYAFFFPAWNLPQQSFYFLYSTSLMALFLESKSIKMWFHSETRVLCTFTGGEWTVLSEEVTDSCYVVKDLPRGASYVFRVGYITKTGAGPFSDASAPVVMATHPEGKNNTLKHDATCLHIQGFIWDQAL